MLGEYDGEEDRAKGDADGLDFLEGAATMNLSDFEKQLNENVNVALHPEPEKKTTVCACRQCGKRMLLLAFKIHCHEIHSDNIEEEADGAQE